VRERPNSYREQRNPFARRLQKIAAKAPRYIVAAHDLIVTETRPHVLSFLVL